MHLGNKLIKKNYPEFSWNNYRNAFLNLFNNTNNSDTDDINMKIWWILTNEQKTEIRKSLTGRITHTSNKVKQNIISIIQLRDSLNWKRNLYKTSIEELIKKQSWNVWIWLEFFLWDALERNNKVERISFGKPWYHLDQHYCSDLFATFVDSEWKKRNIWIDLSIAEKENIKKEKTDKAKRVNTSLDNWIKDYSSKRSPTQIWTLFINRKIIRAWNNCFSKALNKFYNEEEKKGWPSKYLEKGIQKRINKISKLLVWLFERLMENNYNNYNDWEYKISITNNWIETIIKAEKEGVFVFEFLLNK